MRSVSTVRTLKRIVQLSRPLAMFALLLGSAAITTASVVYFDDDDVAPFVLEKLPLPHEDVWLAALQVHVVSAALCLPACLLLLSRTLLRRAPRAHRWLGRVTGVVLVFALAPSGFYLSLFAKGGLAATVGFMLSGVIVVGAMGQGVLTARRGEFSQHRRWMLHVVAQLSVAVSSRAMLFALDAVGADPDASYLVSLWLPLLVSAAAVEWHTFRSPRFVFPWRTHGPPARSRRARLDTRVLDHVAGL